VNESRAAPGAKSARETGAPHLAHVEGLRALAACVVFINHAYAQAFHGGDDTPPWYLSPFTYSMVAGHLSVTVFIVISGFCLMLPVVAADNHLRGEAIGFFRRRARRILPPYYGALVLCLALIATVIGTPTGTLWDFSQNVSPHAIISHVFLLQDLFATSRINYVFWSIAVEWHIYLVFPLLVACWRRFGAGVTVATALVVGYGLRFGADGTRLARANPHYFGMFALGMLAAFLVRGGALVTLRTRILWQSVAAASVASVLLLTHHWGWQGAAARFHFIDLPTGIGAMCVLVLSSQARDSALRRILSFKWLAFVGTFSYSIYLIHAPLLQIVWQYVLRPARLGQTSTFAALMGPGALAIFGAAYAFFRVLEEPFMRPAAAPRPVSRPANAPSASSS
jgi:peptidoglycan/LPS O-acetylase OafA/YrhL